tara:strand:- start:1590 stop:1757 length:168 start_codon:yes stop_codon:yes gene_type:complete
MKEMRGMIKYCSACERKITSVQDDVDYSIEPVEGMYACSLECEHVVTFDLLGKGI